MMFKNRMLLLTGMLLLMLQSAGAQSCWWEPASPLMGQMVTIYYDVTVGTLPDDDTSVLLHWGIYEPETGNWLQPEEAIWPEGSSLHNGTGPAVQSPMNSEGDGLFSISITPTEDITYISFVFTDGSNWDNNSDNNWTIEFVSDDVAAWWIPTDPQTDEPLTIFYNSEAGTIPGTPDPLLLHWGVNEVGHGNWFEPPEAMWPAGTVSTGDGHAVQTPMVFSDGIYSVTITPVDSIHSIHFVFTDGNNWDGNDGMNWDILVGEQPVLHQVLHRFVFDPRSWNYSDLGTSITQVNLAGQFNNWSMSADPMDGPNENGVWHLDYLLEEGLWDYKFVVNGTQWSWDPDNPLINSGDNSNSQVVIVAREAPWILDVEPLDGTNLLLNDPVTFTINLQESDLDSAITSVDLFVNDDPVTFNWDPPEVSWTTTPAAEGDLVLRLEAQDTAGEELEREFLYAVVAEDHEGYISRDPLGDDHGFFGQVEYPTPFGNYADLTGLDITPLADGDSLEFRVRFAMLHDYSRASLQISPGMDMLPGSLPVQVEMETRDWAQGGVFMNLCPPDVGPFDPEFHNVFFDARDPLEPYLPVVVTEDDDALVFTVAVSDLEAVLGSYTWQWYYGVFSYIGGIAPTVGGAYEIGAGDGGTDMPWDCDVYDAMFFDLFDRQSALLGNWSESRTTLLDGTGRGFRAIYPEEIGSGVAAPGPRLQLLTRGADTIYPEQEIVGTVTDDAVPPVIVRVNDTEFQAPVVDGMFTVTVQLEDGENSIQALAVDGDGEQGASSFIEYELIPFHSPVVTAYAITAGPNVQLHSSGTTDPDDDIVGWLWEAEAGNPEDVTINNADQPQAELTNPASDGEYYFRLTVTDAEGNEGTARTFFTVADASITPTNVERGPRWIQDAIIYEIFPRSFSGTGDLQGIIDGLDDIQALGVNTLWLMPIFEGPSDHGYQIDDYYAIEADYGTVDDFDALVDAVHDRGMRIVLDMVINHTGIGHHWMVDCFNYGEYSHYWDYYDRDASGNYTYYYDWQSLPNINVSNEETAWKLKEMGLYWIEEHGVDGYRYDVAWGPQQRNSQFWVVYREEIKRNHPEIFMLAEASVSDFTYLNDRFDSAYDWALHHEGGNGSFTGLYSGTPDLNQLNTLITNYGVGFPDYAYPFRFLENHDETRFIAGNTVEQTKQAAAILYSIPGIPLVYAGQEVGELTPRNQINWSDPNNLRTWYQRLLQIRNDYPVVRSPDLTRLDNDNMGRTYSFLRADASGHLLGVFNVEDMAKNVVVEVPTAELGLSDDSLYVVNDLLNQEAFEMMGSELHLLTLPFDAWQSRLCVIADTLLFDAVQTPGTVPQTLSLRGTWPNPFNPVTTIAWEQPLSTEPTQVAVYNVLGERVALLVDRPLAAGEHQIQWDGSQSASGLYLVRITQGRSAVNAKMLLVK